MHPVPLTFPMLLAILGCGSDIVQACEAVQGQVAGLSLPVFEGETLIGFRVEGATVSGDVTGISSADVVIARADPEGTLHLTGSHTFRDTDGAFLFRTEDEGLTTAEGRIENELTLVEGAAGTLRTEGTVDPKTGALALTYGGTVCR